MRIPYFRGIFMHTTLPTGVRRNEIMNLNNAEGPDSGPVHWVCIAYAKKGNRAIYFNSFGNLRPPKEIVRYLENNVTQIEYNCISSTLRSKQLWSIACNFYERLTINLKTDIVLFKLSIKHVIDIYTDRQE